MANHLANLSRSRGGLRVDPRPRHDGRNDAQISERALDDFVLRGLAHLCGVFRVVWLLLAAQW